MSTDHHNHRGCTGTSRRSFLADMGMGFTGLVLSSLLFKDGVARAADPTTAPIWTPPDGKPHHTPKAKNVIWLFMIGGLSHLESFDCKSALTKYDGKTIEETPIPNPYKQKDFLEQAKDRDQKFAVSAGMRIMAPLVGSQQDAKTGIEVSNWFPNIRNHMEDIAVVRSLWTTDNGHSAQFQFHTGRHMKEGTMFPSLGSWVHYGLGTLNESMPQFVVLGAPAAATNGGVALTGPAYLGELHRGVALSMEKDNPLPYGRPFDGKSIAQEKAQFDLMQKLNENATLEYPEDPFLKARIASYELAFKMQTAVPDAMRVAEESDETRQLYGLDKPTTKAYGAMLLSARRLVEKGVRFVQVFHGGNNDTGKWDGHSNMTPTYTALTDEIDKPIAGLLADLKQRGLLKDTLVVFCTEFGRSPARQSDAPQGAKNDGRQHSPYGFSCWMAGGGVKGGIVHGATDEIGFNAIENRHYVTDVHATVLDLLGLESRKLEVPGRKRLDIDHGNSIKEIIA